MSCYNGVELPPSPGNASQNPLLPSCWISHSFFLRVPMEWGVPSRHHRKWSVSTMVTITPRKRTKGSQVFTNPPMLQNGKKRGKGFKRKKSAEKEERERRGGESLEKSEGDSCSPDRLSTGGTAIRHTLEIQSLVKTETKSGPQITMSQTAGLGSPSSLYSGQRQARCTPARAGEHRKGPCYRRPCC